MERTHPSSLQGSASAIAGRRARGTAIVETVIALPILLAVILGAIQFGLVYQAKATLNHASLQAARSGAVAHAQPQALRDGLARGLAPLYSPDSTLEGVLQTVRRIEAELLTEARIRILNPTREAFADFGEEVDGVREIPNDRLHARSTTLGPLSGINIQDANLLRVEVTYGYELKVPLVNWFIARVLLGTRRDSLDAFEQQLLRRIRLPIVATATVRMQSPARMSDAVIARDDLPEPDRIPAHARPADEAEEGEEDEESQPDGGAAGNDDDSNLSDGFFGFGEGSADGSGGGVTPVGGEGESGGGSGFPGGGNSGNPAQCPIDGGGGNPFPPADPRPGDASPMFRPSPALETTSVPPSLPSLSVGNPIHVVTGNKYQAETDLAPLPGALGLSFVRHYNSDTASHAGVMGAGWRHSYEASLRTSAGAIEILQSDGRIVRFVTTDDRARFDALRASDGKVQILPTGYLWRWRSGRELLFDHDGRLVSIEQYGRAINLLYNAIGQIEQVIDAQRRALRIEYFSNGRISRVHGVAGAAWRYAYDAAGNLAAVVTADGRVRRYEYADSRHPHHLTAIHAGAAAPSPYGASRSPQLLARWAYDERGRAVMSSHPEDAGMITLKYGAGFTDITDAFGRVTRYVTHVRDGVALVTEVRGPGCGNCGRGDAVYEFDARFQVSQLTVKHAAAWRYEYDERHRLRELQRRAGNGFEWIERYEYDGEGHQPITIHRPSIKSDALHTFELAYRPDGQLREVRERGYTPVEAGFAAIERHSRFHHDAAGRLAAIDGPRTDVEDVRRIEYDALGRIVRLRSAAEDILRVRRFDDAGRATLIERAAAPAIRLTYDTAGRLTGKSELRSTGERRVSYTYDLAGRLATVRDADGHLQRIAYDAAGRPNRLSIGDTGMAAMLRYAPDGNVTAAAILGQGDLLLRGVRYIYDDRRRLIEARDGDGPPLRQLTYRDDSPHPAEIIDPLGHVTALSYDDRGALIAARAPDGGLTRFDRDGFGRLTQVTAPNAAKTRYVHDDFGRVVREQNPDRGMLRFAYDAADNLIARTDARGVTVRYSYDAADRLIGIDRREGRTVLRYERSRLIEIAGPESSEEFEYDSDGQVHRHVRTVDGHRFTTTNTYDALGRLQRRTLPSGEILHYTYDARRLTSVSHGMRTQLLLGQKDSTGQATPLDASMHLDYGNGLAMSNVFDPRTGRLIERSTPGLAKFRYEYDEAGRITRIHDGSVSRSFEYDAAGRLTYAQTARGSFRYDYDQSGNRIAESTRSFAGSSRRAGPRLPSSRHHHYAPDSNRLERAWPHRDSIVQYDAAGNPIAVGAQRYEYDSDGRPTRLFTNDRLVAEYGYNSQGERIRKTVFRDGVASTSLFLYDQRRLVAEADDRGNITREYLYSGHHPVAMLHHGRPYWIHTDHLGTPYAVTDETRRVLWRAEYDPFGRAHVDEDPDDDNITLSLHLRFPGQYADTESGTHYNLMRDYDPATGRYLTPDPLGLVDGTNQYAYVHGNPVSGMDALGLYDAYTHFYMTYFLALVAGLPQEVAERIATATQYIDENTQTSPVAGGVLAGALPRYHFTLDYDNGRHGDGTQDVLTRFHNPSSAQLSRLQEITTIPVLERLWDEAHPPVPGTCPIRRIDEARQQLFGEYLHAFEDTFAHRDALNMAYDIYSFNDDNYPRAIIGHVGPSVPDGSHAPDHTYNQTYVAPSQCQIALPDIGIDGRSMYETRTGLSAQECSALQGRFTASSTQAWVYNEVRTLRMEFEVLDLLRTNFADEIESNRARGGRSFTWQDLAGTVSWDSQSVRIGHVDLPVDGVLQRFNAAADTDKWAVLDAWLRERGMNAIIPPLRNNNEPRDTGLANAAMAGVIRQQTLEWIPLSAEGRFNVLLPGPYPEPDPNVD